MGFYIRKSVRVGPFRFNLSESGIGVSTGFKGFRVGTGPRGNYVHMGSGGVYYRTTQTSTQSSQPNFAPSTSNAQLNRSSVEMIETESADVSGMVHSSSAELLNEINEKQQIFRFGPLSLVASVLVMVAAFITVHHGLIIIALACLLTIGVLISFQRDTLRKSIVLLYGLERDTEQLFERFHESVKGLANCSKCWHIAACGQVRDRKYHAGASELVHRSVTSIRFGSPPFLKTNIQTIEIGVGRQTLYFFPDRILVFDSGKIGAVGYEELELDVTQTKFVEIAAPSDATIVDYTWRYVNKKGGPDKRFANNPKLPVCIYDELHFSSRTGLNEIIQISKTGVGKTVTQAIQDLAKVSSVQV